MSKDEDTTRNMEEHPSIPEDASVILSTLHGRMRREERGISKAAFDAAVKYGVRKEGDRDPRTGAKRWIFEYSQGGITVVTNHDCSKEITSWAHPCWGLNVEKVVVTKQMQTDHESAVKESNSHELWNSHAVVVVDQSGSMRKTDAENGVTRSDLVWLSLAVDYIGKRLLNGEATEKDFFTLIELGPQAKVLIKHHPFNWILYNKVIDLLRTLHPLGEGKYIPAMKKAKQMLLSNRKGKCLPQLIFLTDGAPSDKAIRGFQGTMSYHIHALCTGIASIAREFGSRLTVGVIAVGEAKLEVLEPMTTMARDYNCHTFLQKASLKAVDISSAFSSMSTLISSSKSRATDIPTNRQRTFRDLIREPQSSIDIYIPYEEEWVKYHKVKKTVFNKHTREWEYKEDVFHDNRAVALAVREHIFGEGRERAVRRVREVDDFGNFVGPILVGKESLFVEHASDSYSFHKTFFILQTLARQMAERFNREMHRIPGICKETTPIIEFLECSVMRVYDVDGNRKYYLVERMLDHKKYKKWNNNDGFVDKSDSNESGRKKTQSGKDSSGMISFSHEDIPQAFSHFTYLASNRTYLVCDLQGVKNMQTKPPVFELTDPAIHYSEITGRKDYGRTDRGQQGIDDFFHTHKCSSLCHSLLKKWIENPLGKEVIDYKEVSNTISLNNKMPSTKAKGGGSILKRGNTKNEQKPNVQSVKKTVRFG